MSQLSLTSCLRNLTPAGRVSESRVDNLNSEPLAVMTIDVEDWFHVQNLRRVCPPSTWRARTLRLDRTMDRMLELMATWNVQSTCFVLGSVAERAPRLVQKIFQAGHEVASHGFGHDLVSNMSSGAFLSDIKQSKSLLENLTSTPVEGYRAPNFSLTDWAIPLLQTAGYRYDSSFFPTTLAHDRYGKPPTLVSRRQEPIVEVGNLAEVMLSCLDFGSRAFPWSGGGYFRLIPYPIFKIGIEKILRSRKPYIFYIHPWEFDVDQPRPKGLTRSERTRHYLNLEKTEARWELLLQDFNWITIGDLLSKKAAGHDVSAPARNGLTTSYPRTSHRSSRSRNYEENRQLSKDDNRTIT